VFKFFTVAEAATSIPLLDKIKSNILDPLVLLMFAVALLVFLFGVFEMVRGQGSGDARETGGRHILWGTVGMAIMVSVYGILHVVCNTFNICN
jgi:hypothetical protein